MFSQPCSLITLMLLCVRTDWGLMSMSAAEQTRALSVYVAHAPHTQLSLLLYFNLRIVNTELNSQFSLTCFFARSTKANDSTSSKDNYKCLCNLNIQEKSSGGTGFALAGQIYTQVEGHWWWEALLQRSHGRSKWLIRKCDWQSGMRLHRYRFSGRH